MDFSRFLCGLQGALLGLAAGLLAGCLRWRRGRAEADARQEKLTNALYAMVERYAASGAGDDQTDE